MLIFRSNSVRNLKLTNLEWRRKFAQNAGFRCIRPFTQRKSFSGRGLAAGGWRKTNMKQPYLRGRRSCLAALVSVMFILSLCTPIALNAEDDNNRGTNPPPVHFTHHYYGVNGMRRSSSMSEHGPYPQPDPRFANDRRLCL